VPPYDAIKDVIASISTKYKVPVNVFRNVQSMVTAVVHTVCRKFITLVWQVDNVLIEAGSLIKAGDGSNCSNRRLEQLRYLQCIHIHQRNALPPFYA